MTLGEAILYGLDGKVRKRDWCPTCHTDTAIDDGLDDWEPWTPVSQQNLEAISAYIERTMASFHCPGCSE